MSAPEVQTKVLAEDAKAETEAAGEPGNQGSEMQLQEAGHDGTSQPATTSVQPRSGLNEDTGNGMHAGRVDGVEQHGQQGQGDGQDEQNQGNHDPEVQEEIVSSFTEGKKRVKVSFSSEGMVSRLIAVSRQGIRIARTSMGRQGYRLRRGNLRRSVR